jgi:hypothetical protein
MPIHPTRRNHSYQTGKRRKNRKKKESKRKSKKRSKKKSKRRRTEMLS